MQWKKCTEITDKKKEVTGPFSSATLKYDGNVFDAWALAFEHLCQWITIQER